MNEEHDYAYKKLDAAFEKLKKGTETATKELEKDGVIQRFEFTFELLWKTIKIILRSKGIEVKTPKDSLKEAFRLSWIEQEHIFLDMLEDKNKTSHIYDEETAEEIFQRIKRNYLPGIAKVIEKLKDIG